MCIPPPDTLAMRWVSLKREPIVNSAEDAFRTFTRSGIDLLVLDNVLIEKPL